MMLTTVAVLFLIGSAANGWAVWRCHRERQSCRRDARSCRVSRNASFENTIKTADDARTCREAADTTARHLVAVRCREQVKGGG